MRGRIVLAVTLLLAGCGESEPAASNTVAAAPSAAPAQAPVEAAPPVDTGMMTEESGPIPARYVGRWGMGPNDCDPKQADVAKGLMTVEPNRLAFYEARATVRGIDQQGGTMIVDLAFTGEGQTWEVKSAWTLEEDGAVLVRRDTGWENGTFRYRRCKG